MELTIVDKARLLRRVALLSEVPTEVLADLAALSTVQRFEEHTTLISAGDPASAFYFILEGCVRAYRNEEEVHRACAGDVVGGLAVLDGRPHPFTAVADPGTTVLRLGAEDFLDLLEQHQALAKGVIRHLAQQLRDALDGGTARTTED